MKRVCGGRKEPTVGVAVAPKWIAQADETEISVYRAALIEAMRPDWNSFLALMACGRSGILLIPNQLTDKAPLACESI